MNLNQLYHRIVEINSIEGKHGIWSRINRRLKRKLILFSHAYVLSVHIKDIPINLPMDPDLQIREISLSDIGEINAIAKYGFYGRSSDDIKQYLTENQRCFIAQYKGQVASCCWSLRNNFYDYRNYRHFNLANNEIYILGLFTLPEFRGRGIQPLLLSNSLLTQFQDKNDMCAVLFIDIHNKSSVHAVNKIGFTRNGRVGFIDILGIRLHYLFGKNILLKTKPRVYLEISKLP
jgi:ribosomal protein S18 acetylase RimI-like enzyme